ncbi:glycosyltransferase family 39 protein [Cyathus striatus]|nr:glycosyltransferase family 39 protein [Cyathus striatus]
MSGAVRARRPASPPHYPPTSTYTPQPRFPPRSENHLDADAKRAAASQGLGPARIHSLSTKGGDVAGMNITSGEWKLLFGVVLVACAVRMFRISYPDSVVFDEVHFGKFASKYIKTQYFVDVHPPLAKLLITLAGFIFGYDGQFDFKEIAKPYTDVPYVAMRLLPATLGVLTIPLSYLTLRLLDCRATTALLASLFLTFENGLVTQSRHILLDSPLVFFTALTTFFWVGFSNVDRRLPFSQEWWVWLMLSGLSLGAVVSCKWVGLFTIATVGLSTLMQLWTLLGDLRVTPRMWMKHFIARALCLIVVPILFYMLMFQIHFAILENSGDGDGFMSSEFQHTLGGKGMQDTYADVAVGSTITIRHLNTQGGYLHSHAHNYPTGSKQQQITLYPHRDSNNDWLVTNASSDASAVDIDYSSPSTPFTLLPHNSRIKLRHISTSKHLHSHDFRPPVSEVDFQNEVSAYGMAHFAGDANDDWYVEIVEGHRGRRDKYSKERVRTLRSVVRFRHALTGCYLFSHKVKLPDWAYEQQEVTCNKNAVKDNSLWYVETSWHPNLPEKAEKVNYVLPGFLGKFWELQKVMWTTNAGLTDRHSFDSRPDAWPRLRRGINFWVKDHRQIYLIGNPMVWWLSSFAVAAYAGVVGILVLRAKRGFRDFDNTKVMKYTTLCGFLFTGWALHYFPFYLMARQLFLHHYFPALYFAVLLLASVFDLVTSTLRPRVRLQIAAVLICLAIWNFSHLAPLAYGTPWTRLNTWDFSCSDFYDNYAQYAKVGNTTPLNKPVAAAVSTVGGEGRAPIVVQQPVVPQVLQQEKEDTTAVGVPGKAEPGRDIFGEVKVDVASSAPVMQQQPPHREEGERVEKVVSSVVVDGAGGVGAPGGGGGQEAIVGKHVKEGTGEVGGGDVKTEKVEVKSEGKSEGEVKEEVKTETKEEGKAYKEPAGPLGEAEAEAEKVAQELYPDAAAAAAAAAV